MGDRALTDCNSAPTLSHVTHVRFVYENRHAADWRRERSLWQPKRPRRLRARLLQTAASEPAQAQLLFLDFSRIGVATASCLREAIVAFRDVIRSRRSNFYPVIANANVSIKELRELLHRRGSPLMACTLDRNGHVVEVSLLGELNSNRTGHVRSGAGLGRDRRWRTYARVWRE